jgi:TPR repeat protein
MFAYAPTSTVRARHDRSRVSHELNTITDRQMEHSEELLRLAEQGDAKAQYNLGVMYRKGHGVPKNDAEAVNWYRKAAEQGYVDAQYNLGFMYHTGEGVPYDYAKAYMWWSLAKALGDNNVENNLDMIKEEMTRAEIAKAQALAAEWWEKHNN